MFLWIFVGWIGRYVKTPRRSLCIFFWPIDLLVSARKSYNHCMYLDGGFVSHEPVMTTPNCTHNVMLCVYCILCIGIICRSVTCDCSHTQPPTCMTKCCQTFLFGEGAIPVSFSRVFLQWLAPQNGDWWAFNSSGTADFLSSKRHLWRRGDGEIAGYWKKFENLVSASSGRSVKWSMKGMFNQFLAHAKELSFSVTCNFFL